MARALTIDKTWDYVLNEDLVSIDKDGNPCDAPESERTYWRLKAVSESKRDRWIGQWQKLAHTQAEGFAKLVNEVCSEGIAGWTNLRQQSRDGIDEEVEVAKDDQGRLREDCLARIPFYMRAQLCDQILGQNITSIEDRKNSLWRQLRSSATSRSTAEPAA